MLRFDGTDGHLVTRTQFIHEWVAHLLAQGWDIADGSRGKASFPADPDAMAAMRAYFERLQGVAAYGTHAFGEGSLRRRAAEALAREYGIAIDPAQVIFTPGGQFGLALAFKLVLEAREEGIIIAPQPWYLNHHELATLWRPEGASSPFLPVPGDPARHYGWDAETFSAICRNNVHPVAAYLFCNPVNPSGQVVRRAQWAEMAERLRADHAPILLDEAFAEIVFDEDFEMSLLHAAPDLADRCFIFRSGTKALGLAGERLAVTVVPPAFADRFTYWQSRLLGNPAISLQIGMTAALEAMGTEKKTAISRYYRAQAERLQSILRRGLPESCIHPPQGGFYLLADLSALMGRTMAPEVRDKTGHTPPMIQTDEDIALYLLFGGGQPERQGVAVMPASAFGLPPERGLVRISFSSTATEVDAVGTRIVAAINH